MGEARTGTTQVCHYCGRPLIFGSVVYGNNGDIYHEECARPPSTVGCLPIKHLSESDVRRIVQEELAKLPANV